MGNNIKDGNKIGFFVVANNSKTDEVIGSVLLRTFRDKDHALKYLGSDEINELDVVTDAALVRFKELADFDDIPWEDIKITFEILTLFTDIKDQAWSK